jgi:hypothetical protein
LHFRTDRLPDAAATRLLRLFQQLRGHFHLDLSRCFHGSQNTLKRLSHDDWGAMPPTGNGIYNRHPDNIVIPSGAKNLLYVGINRYNKDLRLINQPVMDRIQRQL